MPISILRLGHRIFRDQRITSHCALTARALGARRFFYTGQRDREMEASVRSVVNNWGGPFEVRHLESYKPLLKKYSSSAHLTVYGIPFENRLNQVKKSKNLLVIVGGEKVPSILYREAKWNLAVGSQPHSEVAALGIFLHHLQGFKKFSGKLKVIPQERGKKVISKA